MSQHLCKCGNGATECIRFTECKNKQEYFQPKTLTGAGMGVKHDAGRVDMGMLLEYFPRSLEALGWTVTYGAAKYTRGGWKTVLGGIQRYLAAAMRHFVKVAKGETFDSDPLTAKSLDGLPLTQYHGKVRHDAQVVINYLFWLELRLEAEENARGADRAS